MSMTRGFSALFAAAIFALPATASAQWAPSPTVIIINSSPGFGYGGWGPGVAPTAWDGGCGWGGGCGAGWGGGCGGGCGLGLGAGAVVGPALGPTPYYGGYGYDPGYGYPSYSAYGYNRPGYHRYASGPYSRYRHYYGSARPAHYANWAHR